MLVCLMPLSQYKKKELYRYVETFDLADPSLFEDAVITENLSICLLNKNTIVIHKLLLIEASSNSLGSVNSNVSTCLYNSFFLC